MSFADNIKQNYKPVQNSAGPEQCRIVAQQWVDIAKEELMKNSQQGRTEIRYSSGLISRKMKVVSFRVLVSLKEEYKYPSTHYYEGSPTRIYASKSGYQQLIKEMKQLCSMEGINVSKYENSFQCAHAIDLWVEL